MAPPNDKSGTPEKKKNVEDQIWYHGFRPRKDAMRLITAPGEYLVRATDSGPNTDIVISTCDDNKKTVNITLRSDGKDWFIAQRDPKHAIKHKFPTIVDLVEYYQKHPPGRTLKLSKIVPRPEWMLKHENVVYEEKDKLGSGNFCSVYKGILKKAGADVAVAVKLSLTAGTAAVSDADTEEANAARKAMMHEAHVMSFYTHDNIITFFGVACAHPPVLVIMEFCAGGDLLSHLTRHGKKTDDREKMIYVYEAARGMFYLHFKKCVHRDLAARNCLISSSGKIKIADFGLSKLIDEHDADAENASNNQVPVRWMAPETLKKPAVFSRHSDVWAFGVLTYEIFSNGVKPWPDDPVKYVATQIRKGNMPKMPEGTPPKFAEMVGRMWAATPEKRPAMRVVARDINALIRDANTVHGAYPPEKMTLNKIPGVTRSAYFENEDSSEFEDSSASSTVEHEAAEKADKIDKSGEKAGKRSRPSKGGGRRGGSTREKASVDK